MTVTNTTIPPNPDDPTGGNETDERTLEALRKRANELDVVGRSKMNRDELAAAIATAEAVKTLRTPFAAAMDAQAARANLEATGALHPDAETASDDAGREDLIAVARRRAATRNPRAIGA